MKPFPHADRLIDTIPAFGTDVSALLPTTWVEDVHKCSELHSHWKVLDGGSLTSREEQFRDGTPPKVGVVTGELIAEQLPWLDALYRHEFLSLVNTLVEGHYEVSADLRSSMNINTTPRGSRYEWHVDSNPVTALLFVTSHKPAEGGQLLFRPDPVTRPGEAWELQISPQAGTLLIFDGREAAHVVTHLNMGLRLSIPMNYYLVGHQERPADLQEHLYG